MGLYIAIGCAGLAVIVAGWYGFEFLWDRRLFFKKGEDEFVVNIRTRRAREVIEQCPELILLDVRPRERYEAGHLPEAISAPYLDNRFKPEDLAGLSRERPLLVYCDGGFRSRQAIPAILGAGFKEIYHLHRGYLSWKPRERREQ